MGSHRYRSAWRLGRSFLVVALVSVTLGNHCGDHPPLSPASGMPEYQELAVVAVPFGKVNVAGGNLLVERTDLDIDTHLGTFSVGAVWNSAAKKWHWSFDDLRYDCVNFTDLTGANYNLSNLPLGQAIAGTRWIRLGSACDSLPGGNELKLKGGLKHEFRTDGRPLYVRWTSSNNPYLRFNHGTQGDGKVHTTSIDHCPAGGACDPLFTFAYDTQGRLTSITDRAARMAQFTYDPNGRLASAKDGLDTAKGWPGFRYEYGTYGELLAIVNSEGERVEIAYGTLYPAVNARTQVTQVRPIGAGNPIYSFAHGGSSGGLYSTVFTDPTGRQMRFRYDATRRVVERTVVALAETTAYQWSGVRPSRITLPTGVPTQFTYVGDSVATIVEPSGNVITFAYEPNGVDRASQSTLPILQIADGLGTIETRTYDGQGRLSSVANGAGESITFIYGTDEMISTVTIPTGVATTFGEYGEHGHATSVTSAGGTEYTLTYDEVGNLLSGPSSLVASGPELGGVVERGFDADRNVATVGLDDLCCGLSSDPNPPQTLTIDHRGDGRPARIARPYGGDSEFVYDALGRLVTQREKASGAGHATWQTTSFSYDALGRLTARTLPNGMSAEWVYDPAGRVLQHAIREDSVLQSSISFNYTSGRLVSALDSVHGSPETYAYDSAGRVGTVDYPAGERLALSYDLRSRLTGASFSESSPGPLLGVLGFGYDAAGRETRVQEDGQVLIDRSFLAGRLSSILYGNGLRRTFTYDPASGFLTDVETNEGGNLVESTAISVLDLQLLTAIGTTTETMGAVSMLTHDTHTLGPSRNTDPASLAGRRVISWDSASSGTSQHDYSYDELSNLIGQDYGFVYNLERNRLLEARDAMGALVHDYDYDEAGFVTSRDGVALDWNGAGRIRAIGANVSFIWDSEGRLVSRTVAGVQQKRLFGGLVEANSAGSPTALDLGEVRIDLGTGAHLFRHFDLRGNVKFTTDDEGEVVAHYHYNAYGVEAVYGATGSLEQNRSFARGREYAGLLLLGSRLYDSDAARFLSPDPIPQLVNQYSYTLGNPAYFWDPGGTVSLRLPTVTGEQLFGAIGEGIGKGLLVVFFAKAAEGQTGPRSTDPIVPYAVELAGRAGRLAGEFTGRKIDLFMQEFAFVNVAPRLEFYFDIKGHAPSHPLGPRGGPRPPPEQRREITIEIAPLCSPTSLRETPEFQRMLVLLVPLQVALGFLVLRAARRSSRVARGSTPGSRAANPLRRARDS